MDAMQGPSWVLGCSFSSNLAFDPSDASSTPSDVPSKMSADISKSSRREGGNGGQGRGQAAPDEDHGYRTVFLRQSPAPCKINLSEPICRPRSQTLKQALLQEAAVWQTASFQGPHSGPRFLYPSYALPTLPFPMWLQQDTSEDLTAWQEGHSTVENYFIAFHFPRAKKHLYFDKKTIGQKTTAEKQTTDK